VTEEDAKRFLADNERVVTIAWCQSCSRLVIPVDWPTVRCTVCHVILDEGAPRRRFVAEERRHHG
jgi:hypothetical protein